jgi:hypothetical protein
VYNLFISGLYRVWKKWCIIIMGMGRKPQNKNVKGRIL